MKTARVPIIDSKGRLKYTWEQNLEEIILYFTIENLYFNQEREFKSTNKVFKEDVHIKFTSNKLTVQNKATNSDVFNDVLFDIINVSESLWYIENNELVIQLSKMRKGSVWSSVTKNDESSVNPVDIENMKKQMMLERFQRENPGFDFSNAEFNGNIPDPRSFMGGLRQY